MITIKEIQEKIDQLEVIGVYAYSNSQYEEALEIFNYAVNYIEMHLNINKNILNPSLINSFMYMGLAYEALEDFHSSIKYYNRAIDLYDANDSDYTLANIYTNLGGALRKIKSYNKAIICYQKAILVYSNKKTSISDKQYLNKAKLLVNLGIVYRHNKEYEKAISSYNQAILIYFSSIGENVYNLDYEKITACTYLGIAQERNNDYKGSINSFNLAIDVLLNSNEKKNKSKDIATLLVYIGQDYDSIGEFPKAISYYNKALEVYDIKSFKNTDEYILKKIELLVHKGVSNENLQKYNNAIELYSNAINKLNTLKNKNTSEFYKTKENLENKYGNCLFLINKNIIDESVIVNNYNIAQKSLYRKSRIKNKASVEIRNMNSTSYLDRTKYKSGSINKVDNKIKLAREFVNQGCCYFDNGNYLDAIQNFKKVLELLRPDEQNDSSNKVEVEKYIFATNMMLGTAYNKKGVYSKAIKVYKLLKKSLSSKHFENRKEVSLSKAVLLEQMGFAYRKSNKILKAIKVYKKSQYYINAESLNSENSLNSLRINIASGLGISLRIAQNYQEAIKTYKQALKIYSEGFYKDKGDSGENRAALYMNLGIAQYYNGEYLEAVESYNLATKYYDSGSCMNQPKLDVKRAAIKKNLGDAYKSLNSYRDSKVSYNQAQMIYSGEYCKDKIELNFERAIVELSLGNLHGNNGNYPAAIVSLKKSLLYLDSKFKREKSSYYLTMIKVANSLGQVHKDFGNYAAALRYYKISERHLNNKYCKNKQEYDSSRASLALKLGILHRAAGNYTKAFKFYNKVKKYYSNKRFYISDIDTKRAILSINLGNLYDSKNDYPNTIKAYTKALNYLACKGLEKRTDLDGTRATLLINIGILLLDSNQEQLALNVFLQARGYLFGEYCKSNNYFDIKRAIALRYIGLLQMLEGNQIDAINTYQQVEDIYYYNRSENLNSISGLQQKCSLYSNASHLLTHMEDPLSWAQSRSKILIELLELAPEKDTIPDIETLWQSMRESFTIFHSNWLKYVVETKNYSEIPKILFAIQGRELASEVLDHLEQDGENDAPEVKKYQEIRKQLRALSQRKGQRSMDGMGTITPFDPNQRELTPQARKAQAKIAQEQNDKYQSEYQDLYQQLNQARSDASKVKGYEFLQPDPNQYDIDKIRASIKDSQGLLMLVSLEEIQGILLIKKKVNSSGKKPNSTNWLIKSINSLTAAIITTVN